MRASQFTGGLQNAVGILGSKLRRMTSSDINPAIKIQQAKLASHHVHKVVKEGGAAPWIPVT